MKIDSEELLLLSFRGQVAGVNFWTKLAVYRNDYSKYRRNWRLIAGLFFLTILLFTPQANSLRLAVFVWPIRADCVQLAAVNRLHHATASA
jgi:hypothetical protein